MNSSESIKRKASVRLNDMQAAHFCEVFAQGLSSGLGYARIIAMLERKKVDDAVVQALRHGLLQDGMRLSEVFQQYGLLDRNMRALVDVGEDQGNLPAVFKGQIPIYRERYRRKKAIALGFAEPVILAFVGVGVLAPILSSLVATSELKGWEVFFYILSAMMIPLLVMCVLVSMFVAAVLWWMDTPVDKQGKMSAAWLSIPILSAPSRLYAQSQMARYLAISLRSGMDIFQSVRLSLQASNDPRLISHTNQVIQALEDGLSLEESMGLVPRLHEVLLDYLNVGEETGRMSDMLLEGANVLKATSDELFHAYMTSFKFIMRILLMSAILGYVLFGVIVGQLGTEFTNALKGLD